MMPAMGTYEISKRGQRANHRRLESSSVGLGLVVPIVLWVDFL